MAQKFALKNHCGGVETAEQVSWLLKRGVQYCQGWHFAKALPPREIHRPLQQTPAPSGDKADALQAVTVIAGVIELAAEYTREGFRVIHSPVHAISKSGASVVVAQRPPTGDGAGEYLAYRF